MPCLRFHCIPALLAFLFTCMCMPTSMAKELVKPKTTCQATTERVLAPFLKNLKRALAGQKSHAEQTAAKIERQTKYIAGMRASKVKFEEKRKADLARHDKRIAAAQEAIRDIAKKVAESQKRSSEALKKALAAGDERRAQRIRKAILELRQKFAQKKVTGWSPVLRRTRTTEGWESFIFKEQKARRETVTAHSKGEINVYIRLLRTSPTWKKVLELIASEEKRLADTRARKETFYLPSIRRSMSGEKIDALVKQRRDELADAKARIAAGTFKLYVPRLRRTSDRNSVLAMIAAAKKGLARVRAGWSEGSYRNYNPLVRRTVSTGQIRGWISDAEKALADFRKLGDDARVYVPEVRRTISGRTIRDNIAGARDSNVRSRWQVHYRHWQVARDKEIERKRATINKHKKQLAKHREIWLDDIKKREEQLAGHFTEMLAQTPCGGGTPDQALAGRHNTLLSNISENSLEAACRRAVYGDNVYVTPNGIMHGSPREALLAALADTGVKDGVPQPNKTSQPVGLDQQISWLKDNLDWIMGHANSIGIGIDLSAMSRTRAAIADLESKLRELPRIVRGRGQQFKAARKKIAREFARRIEDLRKMGAYFSSSDFQALENTLKLGVTRKGLKKTREAKEALRRIAQLQANSSNFFSITLPSLKNTTEAIGRATARNLDAARAIANQTVSKAEFRNAWSKMGRLDKVLFTASLAAAAAEMSDRIKGGEPAPEAAFRSGTNLVVELVIGGLPVTAAAEAVSQVLFVSYGYYFNDPGVADATVEKVAKRLAQGTLDKVASISRHLGGSQDVSGEASALANFNDSKLDNFLRRTEDELKKAKPGSPEAARLLRMREAARRLRRAKDRVADIRKIKDEIAKVSHQMASIRTPGPQLDAFKDRLRRLEERLKARLARNC